MTVRKARQERAAQLGVPQSTVPARASSGGPPLTAEPPVAAPAGYAADPQDYGPYDDRVTVTRFDVPFFRLAAFFLKAVLAAVPALILLGAILYGLGVVLRMYFPWIIQTEILIRFPN